MSDIKVKQLSGSGAVIPNVWTKAYAVTASNSTTFEPSNLYIGVGGNVVVVMAENPGSTVTFKGVQAGEFLPVLAVQVYATGTTATDIVRGL